MAVPYSYAYYGQAGVGFPPTMTPPEGPPSGATEWDDRTPPPQNGEPSDRGYYAAPTPAQFAPPMAYAGPNNYYGSMPDQQLPAQFDAPVDTPGGAGGEQGPTPHPQGVPGQPQQRYPPAAQSSPRYQGDGAMTEEYTVTYTGQQTSGGGEEGEKGVTPDEQDSAQKQFLEQGERCTMAVTAFCLSVMAAVYVTSRCWGT